MRLSDEELAAYVADYPECPSSPPCPNCRTVAIARELLGARAILRHIDTYSAGHDDCWWCEAELTMGEPHAETCIAIRARNLLAGES